MNKNYRVQLNFLPIEGEIPAFRVYRKARGATDPKPDDESMGFSLPVRDDVDERELFWVRFGPSDGFEEYVAKPEHNLHLTGRLLTRALCDSAESQLQPVEFEIPRGGFLEEVHFLMHEYSEGHELLTIQPYRLRVNSQFGWLVDFHFRLREGVPFSRRVQQLSLSLDKNYRRNLDYYLDRTNKLDSFLERRRNIVESITLPGATASIRTARHFVVLPARQLRSKAYICGNNRESRSQFNGLRNFGPLQPLSEPPTLLFAFRERDRQAARTLAMALKGSPQRGSYNFPGFQALFKTDLNIDANPIVLSDLSPASFDQALERVKRERAGSALVIPVFVLPEGDDNGYLIHKASFAHEGIPTQVCTVPLIQNDNALRWAIANIALQVFCKAGGMPWKVRPTPDPTLIVGISQSHKVSQDESRSGVERYFAFSVMADNSGLFQRLRVLGDSPDQSQYLQQIRDNLRQILADSASSFARVVLHTSFKLKQREMDAIRDTVRDAASASERASQFAVVKVNHKNRFFGTNTGVNSLVPYEGTVVRLGVGEYLVWFEGIFPDKPTVTKAFPGPTHIRFLHVSDDVGDVDDEPLLQDLANLSGANWRGFNAKSAPVSIFYCHLVADLVREFHQKGLPLPQVEDLRPWFL